MLAAPTGERGQVYKVLLELREQQTKLAEEVLGGLIEEKKAHPAKISLQVIQSRDSAAATLAEHAAQQGTGLIVVPRRRRPAQGTALLGSVAERIAHLCEAPVLLTR